MSSFDPKTDNAALPRTRILVLSFFLVLAVSLLIWRMHFLQVVEHQKHLKVANENRMDVRPVKPKRGLIYDRNGVILADNQASFTLMILPEEIENVEQTQLLLQKKARLNQEQLAIFDKLWSIPRRPFQPVTIKDRLLSSEIASIVVDQHKLPGVTIEAELRRHYPFQNITAHVLGYVGQISEAEKAALNKERIGITQIGKKGIELAYEPTLSGTPGHEFIESNAKGRHLRSLKTQPAVAGMDLQLTIDIELQHAIFDTLSPFNKAAAVAIEPKTGEVLAMVSVPSYDPNEFVFGISQKNFNALRGDSRRPMFNRAIQGQYPPGSVIKPMIALGALTLGKTSWESQIWDPGFFQLENQSHKYRDWKRWGHGKVDLMRAIVESCDTFFYETSSRMGIDELKYYLEGFSIGVRTGIDLEGEPTGRFPTKAWKQENFDQPWYPGETLIASIGQGYVLTTPIQLAQATAVIANRGKNIRPQLVRATRQQGKTDWIRMHQDYIDPSEAKKTKSRIEQTSDEDWARMIEALEAVITAPKGTARGIKQGLTYSMAGKTGTAQVVAIAQDDVYKPDELPEEHLDHALFAGFAPTDDPQIVVAVIIENGGSGGATAAPVARKILDAYLLRKTITPAKPNNKGVEKIP